MPPATARQCIELAEAGSEMVRVTVNVPEAAAAVPEIKQRMLDAGVTAPLIGDFHYNGHLLLTRYPGVRRGARQVPDQSRQRRHGQAARRAVRDDLRRRARPRTSRSASASTAARSTRSSSLAKMQENTDRDLGPDLRGDHQRVHGPVGAAVDRAGARVRAAQGSDHHLVQDLASARSDRGLSRPRRGKTDQPLHLGPDRSRAWAPRGSCGRRPRWACCSTKASATRSACR